MKFGLKYECKLFSNYSVFIAGMRGRGKDMLMSNVCVRRKQPYISNIDYGGNKIDDFHPRKFDTNNNCLDFINSDIKYYKYPYPDRVDIYVSDAQIYFPSFDFKVIDKECKGFAQSISLIRQLGDANFFMNCQVPEKVWDKLRLQFDKFILCRKCVTTPLSWKLKHNPVVLVYDLYQRRESFEAAVPPFPLEKPLLNADRRFQWELAYNNYLIKYGEISRHVVFFFNKSTYDTRRFKTMLENGRKDEPNESIH